MLDEDSGVRSFAARTLGDLGEAAASPEVVSALVQAITGDGDSFVGMGAAWVIIALQTLKPGWRMFKRARGSRYYLVKVSALDAISSQDLVTGTVGPETYLREVLSRIADYPINRIEELLPWNFAKTPQCANQPAA